jgi:hypothetical protein
LVGIDQVLLDGTQYAIDEMPGLYYDHIDKLAPAQIVTIAEWNSDTTKQHFYAVDLLGGVFKVPKDLDMHYRALKTNDGANGMPGAYTPDTVKVPDGVQGVKQTGQNTAKGTLDNITTPGHQFDLTEPFDISTGTETAEKAVRQYAAVYI